MKYRGKEFLGELKKLQAETSEREGYTVQDGHIFKSLFQICSDSAVTNCTWCLAGGGASVKSLMAWRIPRRNDLRTRFLKLVPPFICNCIFSNSLDQIDWGFWYLKKYLHSLSVEVNRKLPSDTDVIQITPTFHLEVKLPTAIKFPTPEMLPAFWSLEKILQLEVTGICKIPEWLLGGSSFRISFGDVWNWPQSPMFKKYSFTSTNKVAKLCQVK